MDTIRSCSNADLNPLQSDSPRAWDELIEAVGPASLLVVIESRMSAALRRQITPEDILQDALLHAWRDREKCEWRGVHGFRSWLLSIIDNRIREAADRQSALKRGGGKAPLPIHHTSGSGSDWGPAGSTTPSRVAIYREQCDAMRAALETVPEEFREVLRLRLYEQLSLEQIAERLEIGLYASRHRFRKGSEIYYERLRAEFTSRSLPLPTLGAPVNGGDSSP
ncbi:MAG: sigma-70 family RNA polymerase sigma factor [Planctomycetota bacterium]